MEKNVFQKMFPTCDVWLRLDDGCHMSQPYLGTFMEGTFHLACATPKTFKNLWFKQYLQNLTGYFKDALM